MQIKDIMTKKVISISPNESAAVAARLLAQHNIGALPVCGREGSVRGMLTDRDIVLRCVAAEDDIRTTKVSELMTRRVVSVDAEDSVETASALMARAQVRRLPVEQDGRLVGMVSLGDLAKAPQCNQSAANALTEISENMRTM